MKEKVIRHFGKKCVGPTLSSKQLGALRRELIQQKSLRSSLNLFQLLSGQTRLWILYLLHQEKELCVCDLAEVLQTTISAVSHQLRLLRKANIVKTRRNGQTIYYSLISRRLLKFLNE